MPTLRWAVRQHEATLCDVDARLPPVLDDERERAASLRLPAGAEPLILRAAYYLGETFARERPERLRWASGDRETMTGNQPVVTGFTRNMELPVILVVENLFRRAGDAEGIPEAVAAWTERVPRR